MSSRTEAETVPARIAALEEAVRRLQTRGSIAAGTPADAVPASAYIKVGDIIAGGPLGHPERVEVGPAGSTLVADPTTRQGVTWSAGGDALLLAWLGLGAP